MVGLEKKLKSQSFSRKLILITMVTTVATLLFFATLSTSFFVYSLRSSLLTEYDTLADVIAANLSASLLFNDQEFAAESLSMLEKQPEINSVCVFNSEHEFFASYHRNRINSQICTLEKGLGYRFVGNQLTVARAINVNSREIGFITLIVTMDRIQHNLWSMALVIGSALIFSIILALYITRKMRHIILRPVISLVEVAEEVRQKGNYSVRAARTSEDELGKLVETFNSMLDQVEKHNAELEKARMDAEAANHSKSEFLANMSHELRTPMHGILASAEMVQDYMKEGNTRLVTKRMDAIQVSAERLMRLLNDLLDLSKLEAGMMTFRFEFAELGKIVEQSKSSFLELMKEKDITLEYQSEEEFDKARFKLDAGRIEQVMCNLLSNAIKYSPKGGKIVIRLQQQEKNGQKFILYRIFDDGPGVPEGEEDTIFDKFIQSSQTKTGAGGTGLGLSICKEIIEAHKGDIGYEKTDNGKSSFYFSIPNIKEEPVES